MGDRSPNAGSADVRVTLPNGLQPVRSFLWVGCARPEAGPAYHDAARLTEGLTLADGLQLRLLLSSRDPQAIEAFLLNSSAAAWWARVRPVLVAAWPSTPHPAMTLWQAVGAPEPTGWQFGPEYYF